MSFNEKKVLIVKKDGQEEFYGKLKNVMEQLPAGFLMIHQSYVIHQQYVSEYSYESIKMMNGDVFMILIVGILHMALLQKAKEELKKWKRILCFLRRWICILSISMSLLEIFWTMQ